MSVSAEWRDYVLEQLSAIRGVSARALFGGAGLYAGGGIFGLLDNDQLFFKVDDLTRPDYVKRKAKPWDPSPGNYPPSKGYYEIPADILDDREEMTAWARRAMEVSARAKAKKRKPAAKKKPAPRKKRGR